MSSHPAVGSPPNECSGGEGGQTCRTICQGGNSFKIPFYVPCQNPYTAQDGRCYDLIPNRHGSGCDCTYATTPVNCYNTNTHSFDR